jgi:hypothetical protein
LYKIKGDSIAIIDYHVWDDLVMPEGDYRVSSYYGIGAVPTAKFDGQYTVVDANPATFPVYLANFRNRIAVTTPCSLSLAGTSFDPASRKLKIKAWIKAVDWAPFNSLRLRCAITESDIEYQGEIYNNVLRKLLPDVSGDSFRVVFPGETFIDSQICIIPSDWKAENLQVVVFAQYDLTKKVAVSNSVWLNQIGDANRDAIVDIGDVMSLIQYFFHSRTLPPCLTCADVNSDCQIDFSDIVYLINYLFWGGEPPRLGCN